MRNDLNPILGEFYTLPVLARKLGRHVATLSRWVNEPDGLPTARLGRTRVTTEAWVAQWLATRKTQRNPPRTKGRAA